MQHIMPNVGAAGLHKFTQVDWRAQVIYITPAVQSDFCVYQTLDDTKTSSAATTVH